MRNKIIIFTGILFLLGFATQCKVEEPNENELVGDRLSKDLYSSGNTVGIPVSDSANAGAVIGANVVDLNGDDVGDGLDVSGNGSPDAVYLNSSVTSATLGKAASLPAVPEGVIILDVDKDSEADYYIKIVDSNTYTIRMSKNQDVSGDEVKVVVENVKILGFDEDGDGQADNTALADVKPGIVSPGFGGACYYIDSTTTPTTFFCQELLTSSPIPTTEAVESVCVGEKFEFSAVPCQRANSFGRCEYNPEGAPASMGQFYYENAGVSANDAQVMCESSDAATLTSGLENFDLTEVQDLFSGAFTDFSGFGSYGGSWVPAE